MGKYIVDFICHEKHLIIAVDGGPHFESEKDIERTRWLEKRGCRVIRFWNTGVLKEIDRVLQVILKELETR